MKPHPTDLCSCRAGLPQQSGPKHVATREMQVHAYCLLPAASPMQTGFRDQPTRRPCGVQPPLISAPCTAAVRQERSTGDPVRRRPPARCRGPYDRERPAGRRPWWRLDRRAVWYRCGPVYYPGGPIERCGFSEILGTSPHTCDRYW